jgi:hypothetical protein
MHIATQFSVFLVNKPGVLAQVTSKLADAKVNIVAMTMTDSMEHGVLRLVAEKPEKARQVVGSLNIPVTETEVLAVPLANQPGALADVCQRLAEAHININYAYSTARSSRGQTTAILKVADLKKAMKVLEVRKPLRKEPTGKLRHPRSANRR